MINYLNNRAFVLVKREKSVSLFEQENNHLLEKYYAGSVSLSEQESTNPGLHSWRDIAVISCN